MPNPGKYMLNIYSTSNTYNTRQTFSNICEYQINCQVIRPLSKTFLRPPFPVIDSFYGISVPNYQLVARPVSHRGAVVECNENGEAKIVMKVAKNDGYVSFSHTLYEASAVPAKSLPKGWVIHSFEETSSQTNVVFVLRTPKPGNYALALYSNANDTSSNTLVQFGYYLVISQKQTKKNTKFPDVANGLVGRIQPRFDSLHLDVASIQPNTKNNSWKSGILHTDMTGELTIVFKHSEPLLLSTKLSSSIQDDHFEYVSAETTGKVTAITIHPPNNDICCLHVYAAPIDHTESLPSVFVAMIHPNYSYQKTKISKLPQCPIAMWGPSWKNFIENGVKRVLFQKSRSTFQGICQHPELDKSGPTRIYNGGADFEIDLELQWPLKLKAQLQNLNSKSENLDKFVLLEKADINSATIRVRFPSKGIFSLALFGSANDDSSGNLFPLLHCLINSKAHSLSTSPFPTNYTIWGESAHQLYGPLSRSIMRNREVYIKVFLAKYQKSKTGWSTVPFPEVSALVDGNSQVARFARTGCVYEWKYFAGPGEKELGILVKPDAEDSKRTYALKFEIV